MLTDALYLIGSGGHMLVVYDAIFLNYKNSKIIKIFDSDLEKVGTTYYGNKVEKIDYKYFSKKSFHVCIGNNYYRKKMFDRIINIGGNPETVIHPTSSVSSSSDVSEGCFVAANATIAPFASLGSGVIVNHNAVVDHQCIVEDYCHIAPGSTLAGGVRIGCEVLVGAGARVLPGVRIGSRATIGAGAVVTKDVPANSVYVGVPARKAI